MFHFLTWLRRRSTTRSTSPIRRQPSKPVLRLEPLEDKVVPSITWTPLTNQPTETVSSGVAGIETMMLLSNGVVMAQGGGVAPFVGDYGSAQWFPLTPDATGGYVGGDWTAAASMANFRQYYGSNVLPNGNIVVIGGEDSGPGEDTNLGEVYNPTANSWTAAATFPQTNFGDDSSILLQNGQVLAGYLLGPQSYLYTPSGNPQSDSWTQTGTKLYSDQSDEENWALLPGNTVLSYDIWSSDANNVFQAQRYVPDGQSFPWGGTSTGQWVDASHLATSPNTPGFLSNNGTNDYADELGPEVLLQNGLVWVMGANATSAYYDPSGYTYNSGTDTYSMGTWSAGPTLPTVDSVQLAAQDDPAAVLPNGNVLLALSPESAPSYSTPTYIYEFNPGSNSFTRLDNAAGFPTDLATTLSGVNAYQTRMLDLPNGHVLLSVDDSTQVWDFSDSSGTPASTPMISSFSNNGNGTFTLDGSGLTGLTEGAYYGDDAEMSTNYPIVSLTSTTTGDVWYATTTGWTPGLDEGSSSVQVALPLNLPADAYSVTVSASGVSSSAYSFSWGGPVYVEADWTGDAPGTSIATPDPLNSSTPAGSIYNSSTGMGNCFSTLIGADGAIAVAADRGTWVVVNGASSTTGSGDFSEDVVDNSTVLLDLQQGGVTFDSLAGDNDGATIVLNGVDLTTDADSSNDPWDGVLEGTGGLDKVGTQTLPLAGDDSGYSGTVTITGGSVQLNNSNALVDSTVDVEAALGLKTGSLSAATIGALEGTGNVDLESAELTVGVNNADATYTGDLSETSGSSVTKVGGATWSLGGDNTEYLGNATIDAGTVELDSASALRGSTVDVETMPGAGGLSVGSGVTATTIGGLTGGGDVAMGGTSMSSTDFTIGVDDADTTYSGTFLQFGSLDKEGTGTLTLTGTSEDAGTTTVSDGTLALADGDTSLPSGSVEVDGAFTILEFTENGDMGYATTFSDGGTMSVDAGKTVSLTGTFAGVSSGFGRGYLSGAGTFATEDYPSATTFTHMIANSGPTIDANSPIDQFIDFDNAATFNITYGDNPGSTVNMACFTNEGAGSIEVYANSLVNFKNLESYGMLTIDPGDSGSTTLMTNVGTTALNLGDGSETFIGTPETANSGGSPTFRAGIDVEGNNIDLYKGLLVNNGYISNFGSGSPEIIVDGGGTTDGALYKGAGFTGISVHTQNGGEVQAGNSPGSDSIATLAFGPGAVSNYRFEIDDAAGAAGPSPDSAGHVDGWSLVNAGDFTWTADSGNQLTVDVETLINPTTVGTDPSGSMANFDPTQSYVWEAVHWTGTYTGPTDAATLNAATNFNTSGFVNAAGGKFSWQLDTTAQTLSLVYTPPPAVAAVALNDTGSGVQSLTVTFSSAVSFAGGDAAAAFRLTNVDTGATVTLSATVSTDSSGRTVVTLTFSGDQTDSVGALLSGRYALTVVGSAVTGSDGTALDGSGTGTGNGVDFNGPNWTIG